MRRFAILAWILAASLLAFPSRPPAPRAPSRHEIFYGVLTNIDGQEIKLWESRVFTSVEAMNGTDWPSRYSVILRCDDFGMRWPTEKSGQPTGEAFWASYMLYAPRPNLEFAHCPEADPSRINRIRDVMIAEGKLELLHRAVRLSSQKGFAEFQGTDRPID